MKENNTYNEELGGKNLPDSLRVNPFLTPNNFFQNQAEQIFSSIRMEDFVQKENVSESENATKIGVPEGYFDHLSDQIFSKIKIQQLKEQIPSDGFTLPEEYFKQLPLDIESKIAEDNLKSIAAKLDYQVPADYFETSQEQIIAKLAEQSLFDQVGKENNFTVPEDYFENSISEIESAVFIEKLQNTIGKDNFNVPVGYFEQLSESILAKTSVSKKQETNILTLPKRTNWKKYSAAAAIVLLLGTASFWGLQRNNLSSSNQLANSDINVENVSDEEILSYLAQVSDGEDLIHLAEYVSDTNEETTQLDSEIENEEIEEYLNYML